MAIRAKPQRYRVITEQRRKALMVGRGGWRFVILFAVAALLLSAAMQHAAVERTAFDVNDDDNDDDYGYGI